LIALIIDAHRPNRSQSHDKDDTHDKKDLLASHPSG
jgi:hypothetical protein